MVNCCNRFLSELACMDRYLTLPRRFSTEQETLRKPRKLPSKNSSQDTVLHEGEADLAPPSLTLLITKQAFSRGHPRFDKLANSALIICWGDFFIICHPSYAFSNFSISNFFIGKNVRVSLSICSGVPFFIISPITVGQTCQETPNLSFSQPHCSAFGSAESFSQ